MKPIPNNIAAQIIAFSRVSKSIGSIGSSLTFGPTNISVILESMIISMWSERLGPSTQRYNSNHGILHLQFPTEV